MKLKAFVLLLSITISSHSAAAEVDLVAKYKEKVRPYAVKYIGEEWATKILGAPADLIALPAIPKVSEDVKATLTVDESTIGKPIADADAKKKYDVLFVSELYKVVRGEVANDSDISQWYNVLSQGGTREGVYRALILDNIYGGMENGDTPVNDGVLDFTVGYMGRFLAKGIRKKSMEGVNFYRLKREVTGRTLDLIDVLAQNPENLYDWYAVFSADIAADYGTIFKNGLRGDKSSLKHKKWAKSVPFQMLKSEVIIKLHKVYNSLI